MPASCWHSTLAYYAFIMPAYLTQAYVSSAKGIGFFDEGQVIAVVIVMSCCYYKFININIASTISCLLSFDNTSSQTSLTC